MFLAGLSCADRPVGVQSRHLVPDTYISKYLSGYTESRGEENARLWNGDLAGDGTLGYGWTHYHNGNRPGLDIYLGWYQLR